MISSAARLTPPLVFFCLMLSQAAAEVPIDAKALLKNMDRAYARVEDYRTRVDVRVYKADDSFETKRFIYTFKKPKWVRLDLESPHSGMILVYPDRDGNVVVRPSGLARFLRLHLGPDSSFLREPSGQRIDQTELGLLIRNIGHSLTDQRRGPVEIRETGQDIRIQVPAVDHFREGIVTLYRFFIDTRLWLPVRVEESTPDGRLERAVTFDDLTVNTGIPDTVFQLDNGTGRENERTGNRQNSK